MATWRSAISRLVAADRAITGSPSRPAELLSDDLGSGILVFDERAAQRHADFEGGGIELVNPWRAIT
jgi:hypothetical protein